MAKREEDCGVGGNSGGSGGSLDLGAHLKSTCRGAAELSTCAQGCGRLLANQSPILYAGDLYFACGHSMLLLLRLPF
eukprot:5699103-Pleurochrysis_carterae.AAC.2